MMDRLLTIGKKKVLIGAGCQVILIAAADWAVGHEVSLGILYILPTMLAAPFLPWAEAVLFALICAFLRACFDTPSTELETVLRFFFSAFCYFSTSSLVALFVRNHQFVVEQTALAADRAVREAEDVTPLLVSSSPAGILTLDGSGAVLVANQAAHALFAIPDGESLNGRAIQEFLPVLADALLVPSAPHGFRTATQCQGRRANGEIFLAQVWFSSYAAQDGHRLSAIVVDSSEEMRDREEENLRLLKESNRIMAAAVSHEMKTLCGAVALASSHLEEKQMHDARSLAEDDDFRGLVHLVAGLKKLANHELYARAGEGGDVRAVCLRDVLDDLRIVIESEWLAIDGRVIWDLPEHLPIVSADAHGLLQACLNLAQNSLRAVHDCALRELRISASSSEGRVLVRFHDTGLGVTSPENLFQPFSRDAEGTGMGLYVSRSVLRSYGGDLHFDPKAEGCCFIMELRLG